MADTLPETIPEVIATTLDAPFGQADGCLLEWIFDTRAFNGMHDQAGGGGGVDEGCPNNWGRADAR